MQNLWYLFLSFAKIGVIGYGGGPAMIPLFQADVVETYKWMTMTEFTDAMALGYTLPGPLATKMALMVGYKVAGIPGALVALLGVILPSAILVLGLYIFFYTFKDNPYIGSLLKGIRPVILALLILVVYNMTPGAVVSWSTGIMAVLTLLVFIFTDLHPAIAIVIGGFVGLIFF